MKDIKERVITVFVMFFVMFSEKAFATKISILTEHLAPFQIVSADSIKGLSTEIVTATLDESDFEYDITSYPWALSYSRAKHEKNTCVYSLARIPQREPLFHWIGHIASSTISLYSLQTSPIVVSKIEDAKKYNVAVIRDDVTHQFLLSKGFKENENLYVVDNYNALLKLLDISSRNIDLVALNDDLLKYRVKNMSDTSKYKSLFQFKELTLNFHLACSLSTDQKIVNKLINVMNRLEKNDVFFGIRNKWKKDMVSLIN
jgi:polar amino acid transport system substrate-binding protein